MDYTEHLAVQLKLINSVLGIEDASPFLEGFAPLNDNACDRSFCLNSIGDKNAAFGYFLFLVGLYENPFFCRLEKHISSQLGRVVAELGAFEALVDLAVVEAAGQI